MKCLAAFLLPVAMAFGQAPGKIITFNRADTEHCKVVVAGKTPLLQSTFEGTSVAVAMPVNRGNGDFSVFVSVSRAEHGTVRVNPQDFYGVYSDKDHTRFPFYDKAAEMASETHSQGGNAQISASNAQIDPGSMRPGAVEGGGPPGGAMPGGPPPGAGPGPSLSAVYFRKGKVKTGAGMAGWITLRQPKSGALEVHPSDMLDEVDIPVNGILFRF